LPYGNSIKRDLPHIPVFLESATQGGGFKANRINKIRREGSVLSTVIKISLFAFLCYYTISLSNDLAERDIILKDMRRDFENAEDTLEQNDAKIKAALGSIESLQSQFGQLLTEDQREEIADGKDLNSEVMYQKIVEKQSAMVSRVNDLQNRIAQLHRVESMEQFGNGVYIVQFNIQIEGGIFPFVVELAGLELMPHSVQYFMQMVSAKVWDNTVFNHRASRILFAELKDTEGNDKINLLVEKHIPTKLSFPEYTDKYPHHKYTLGFSGRPGGPGFYINTDDNAQTHGPGGQTMHALHEEADPCFGTVVEGQQVIDWMQTMTNKGHNDQYTVIESVRIVE